MPQIVYCVDENGYYMHSEYCTIDPIESARTGHDIYVLPARGYLDEPVIAGGYVAKRVNGAWVNVENHVGEKGYINGVPAEIKEYGPLPDGWSIAAPAPTLDDQLASLKSSYDIRLAALDTSLQNALWVGGTQGAATRAALSAKRTALLRERSAAIKALTGK